MNRLFLGRHGREEYDDDLDANVLSADGVADGHRMAHHLKVVGFAGGIILSSTLDRAVRTARIVRIDLGLRSIVRSEMVAKAGLHPDPVRDVHGFVGNVLNGCNVDHTEADVMVVTHAPLIKGVTGQFPEDGQIYQVEPGTPNREFRPDFEFLMKEPDLWRL